LPAVAREEAQDLADFEGTDVPSEPQKGVVDLCLQVKGKRPISHLIAKLSDIDGVVGVGTADGATEME
jgi:putative Mg2+ transporter-C (MgtC) family protein